MIKLLRTVIDKEMTNIPVYKYKTKHGTAWYVKIGSTTKRGFRTKKEAESYLKGKQAKESKSIVKTGPMFYEVLNDYIRSLSEEHDCSIGTVRKKEGCANNVIFKIFPDKPIDQITKRDCASFRSKVKTLDYSTSYKNYILQMFKAIFKHAMKYYDLQNDPSMYLDSFKKTFDEQLKQKNKDGNLWNDDDFNKFIKCVEGERYKVFFTVLFYTGLRLGEAQALKWKDFDGEVLHIYKAMTKDSGKEGCGVSKPKTVNSVRDVEVGTELSKYLYEWKDKQMKRKCFSEDWYIFGDTHYIARTTATRHKDDAIKISGVPFITLHDFRHSHASNLIAKGVNIVSVSRRLGHSSVSITLDTYTHLINKTDSNLISNLGFKK